MRYKIFCFLEDHLPIIVLMAVLGFLGILIFAAAIHDPLENPRNAGVIQCIPIGTDVPLHEPCDGADNDCGASQSAGYYDGRFRYIRSVKEGDVSFYDEDRRRVHLIGVSCFIRRDIPR